MIIGFCLGIMFILSLISMVMGNSLIGNTFTSVIDNSAIINGSTTTFELPDISGNFYIDPIQGALVVFAGILIVVGIAGLNILGSGLNDEAVRVVTVCAVYTGIWFIGSTLAFPLLIAIETFGQMIYWTITLLYIWGVVKSNWGGNE